MMFAGRPIHPGFILWLLCALWSAPPLAAVYELGSIAEMQARPDRAVPGDTKGVSHT